MKQGKRLEIPALRLQLVSKELALRLHASSRLTSATSAKPSEVSPSPWQITTRALWLASFRGVTVMVPSPLRSVLNDMTDFGRAAHVVAVAQQSHAHRWNVRFLPMLMLLVVAAVVAALAAFGRSNDPTKSIQPIQRASLPASTDYKEIEIQGVRLRVRSFPL